MLRLLLVRLSALPPYPGGARRGSRRCGLLSRVGKAAAVAANSHHGFWKSGSGAVPRLRSKIEFVQAARYGSIEARRDAGTAFSKFAIIKICLRRALAPTFAAGDLVFFIPWRVVTENPARRSSTCRLTRSRRLVGAAACGRTMVMSPAAPDFFVAIFGADAGARAIELRGRQRRQPGSKAAQTGSTPCSLSRISGCRDRGLYPLARPRAERHLLPLRRAPNSFLAIAVGAIDGARASGADDDVGGRRRSQLRGRRLIVGLLRAAAGGSTPCSLSRISGCRDRGLYPLARPRAERHLLPLRRAPIPF